MPARALLAALVAVAFLGLGAGAALALGPPERMAGQWRVSYVDPTFKTRRTCTVTLRTDRSFGKLRASSFGCGGKLFNVSRWRTNQSGRVVLLDFSDNRLADLRGNRHRLVGRTVDGAHMVMTRDGVF